ncbi:MAG: hypothetical protein JWO50_220 [Candidatus Kaiserbacteria bacterium]|nr:hypothetical protein [Candidatus Kaiserbacteria bacterium]
MNGFTRTIVLMTTAFIALIIGMALAAYSAPVGHPLVRHMTISESLARGGLTLPSSLGESFTSILTSPDVLSRAFSPASIATRPHAFVAMPTPVFVTNLYPAFLHLHTPIAETAKGTKVRLTQIPYTGFDFGPVGNSIYWLALFLFALSAAYLLIYSQSRFFRSISNVIRKTALSIDSLRGV